MTHRPIVLPIGKIDADSFRHPVTELKLIETHLSWVILTGDRAYKMMKPVNFGFVDCRKLQDRKTFCERELTVNAAYADDIYLQIDPVSCGPSRVSFGEGGRADEYAVVMRQFDENNVVAKRVEDGRFTAGNARLLGRQIAAWHANLPKLEHDSAPVSESIRDTFNTTCRALHELIPNARLSGLSQLETWANTFLLRNEARLNRRRQLRHFACCHGDLHLDNLLFDGDRFSAFDAIDFSDALRTIDTAADLAFPVVDLEARGHADLARHVLSSYVEASGDYDSLGVIRFYLVARAFVRALVTLMRSSDQQRFAHSFAYLEAARRVVAGDALHLAITHGVSGSGKTTAARHYAAETGAIWIRSDVERDRLPEDLDTTAVQDKYGAVAIERTYDYLLRLAEQTVRNGWPVIVDATFLKASQRARFAGLADQLGVPFSIVDCDVSPAVAAERIAQRRHTGLDASEADLLVLEQQLHTAEPLTMFERSRVCCGRFDHCPNSESCATAHFTGAVTCDERSGRNVAQTRSDVEPSRESNEAP